MIVASMSSWLRALRTSAPYRGRNAHCIVSDARVQQPQFLRGDDRAAVRLGARCIRDVDSNWMTPINR